MPTIFTRIIDGEIPGTFVWRDDRCVVFMSINPMARGHALVVPIEELDQWVDGDRALIAHLFEVVRVIGLAQRAAFSPTRIGVIIAGYEVPHMHIHVIPTDTMAQLSFANAAASVEGRDLDAAAEAIRSELRAMGRDEVVVGRTAGLTGRSWTLTKLGDEAADPEVTTELRFGDDGRISGSGGVNRLMGGFQAGDHEITFTAVASTRMAGPPGAMAQEQAVLDVLAGTQPWSIEGDTLTIGGATFIGSSSERAPARPPHAG